MFNTYYIAIVTSLIIFLTGCSKVDWGARNPFYFPQQVEMEESLSGPWYGCLQTGSDQVQDFSLSDLLFKLYPKNWDCYTLKNYEFFCKLNEDNSILNIDGELHLFKFDGEYYMDILFEDPVAHLPNHHLLKLYIIGDWMVTAHLSPDILSQTGFKFITCSGDTESEKWNYCTTSTLEFQSFISSANLNNENIFEIKASYGCPLYFSKNTLPVKSHGVLSSDYRTISYYSLISRFIENFNENMKIDKDFGFNLASLAVLSHNTDTLQGIDQLFGARENGSPFPPLPQSFDTNDIATFVEQMADKIEKDSTEKNSFTLTEPQKTELKQLVIQILTNDLTKGVDSKVVAVTQAYAEALKSLYVEGKTDDTVLLFIQARKKLKIARKYVEELKYKR